MKKLILILIPLILIGVVAGLAFTGIINIPGISPKKAQKNAAALYSEKDDKKVTAAVVPQPANPVTPVKTPPAKPKPVVTKVLTDPEQGAETLAVVWNKLKASDLLAISKDWKDPDFAKVLAHMETGKVAKILEALAAGDPDAKPPIPPNAVRASKLSKILRDQGSILPSDEKGNKTT